MLTKHNKKDTIIVDFDKDEITNSSILSNEYPKMREKWKTKINLID